MPTGYKNRIVVTESCPICKKKFSYFKGQYKFTCSRSCGNKLRVSKVTGTKRKQIRDDGRCINKIIIEKIKEREKLRKDLESHLIDQLADSYDEGVLV